MIIQRKKPWALGEEVRYRGHTWVVYDYPAETFVDRDLLGKVCLVRIEKCRRHAHSSPDCQDCVQGIPIQRFARFKSV